MTFKKKITYECEDCGKVFELEPEYCTCYQKYCKGRIIGSWLILENKNSKSEIKVRCVLCDLTEKEMHYSNIERTKSCGCKPSHIHLLTVKKDSVKYMCRKCTSLKTVLVPVFSWCCTEDE